MTEQDAIDRFNRELDELLSDSGLSNQQPTTAEHQQVMELARTLAEIDFSDESRIRASVRRRLLSGQTTRDHSFKEKLTMLTHTYNRILVPIAAVIIILAGIVALPPAVALAKQILFQIGVITITDEPTDAQQIAEDFGSETEMGAMPAPTPNYAFWDYVMPLPEANVILGTPVLMPAYVPEGYTLTLRFGGPNTPGGPSISMTYNTAGNQQALIIEQKRLSPDYQLEYEMGDAQIVSVTVRGHEGIYAEQVDAGWINNALSYDETTGEVVVNPQAAGQEASTWKLTVLLWEENGTTFRLMADALPIAELLNVAESLQ